jgi:hypothetical protein
VVPVVMPAAVMAAVVPAVVIVLAETARARTFGGGPVMPVAIATIVLAGTLPVVAAAAIAVMPAVTDVRRLAALVVGGDALCE